MKRLLCYFSFFCTFCCVILFTSCSEKNIEEMPTNKTAEVVYVVNNMFVFQDYSHINGMIAYFSKLSEKEKEEWYDNYGIQTYGQLFRKVIEQEDSISNYYFNLPEDKQRYFRTLPQVHSDQYKYALNRGVVKVVKTDDNEYFDINLIDRKYADFLNLDGKVIIGNNVICINECEEKVYFDAINSSSQIDLSKFKHATIRTSESFNEKLKSTDENNWSFTSSARYYDKNIFGNYTKKTWAEINGSSHLMRIFEHESSTCSASLYCIFDLISYAQKMNFWGNYVFTNWTPTVLFYGTWSYQHASWNEDDPALGDQCLCGYDSWDITYGVNGFPAYSCYPNPNYMCPTSPYSRSTAGNNIVQPLTPEGIIPYNYGNGGYWWARPIQVYDANITIMIDGYPFNFQW